VTSPLSLCCGHGHCDRRNACRLGFHCLNRYAEELEPEAMQQAKREDKKLGAFGKRETWNR
jgi:hypothetical protein